MANPFDPFGMSGVGQFQEKQPLVIPAQRSSKGGVLPEIEKIALMVGMNMALPGSGGAVGSILPGAAEGLTSAGAGWLSGVSTNPFLQTASNSLW